MPLPWQLHTPSNNPSDTIRPGMFGGNLLFDRDSVQFAENGDRISSIHQQLGLTTLRYPGGTITETLFNMTDPDSPIPVGALTADPRVFDPDWSGPLTPRLLGLTDALEYCAEEGMGFTFVMPTVRFAGTARDADGNRFANVDVAAVRTLLHKMLTTAHELSVKIEAIELGNEWWSQESDKLGETLSAIEYGRIASRLAEITQSEIDAFRLEKGLAQNWHEPDIVVQVGLGGFADYVTPEGERPPTGYVGFRESSTELIFNEFERDAEKQAVDGILTHFYPNVVDVRAINDTTFDPFTLWDRLAELDDQFKTADRYVTEWNVMFGATALSGPKQGAAILKIFATMINSGVDHANVWAVQQHMPTRLATSNGTAGDDSEDLTFAGDVFSLMSSSLIGTRLISAEHGGFTYSQYVYTCKGKTVVFLSSQRDLAFELNIDLTDLGHRDASVSGLAVAPGNELLSAGAMTSTGTHSINVNGLEDWRGSIRVEPYAVVRLIFDTSRPVGNGSPDNEPISPDGSNVLVSNRPNSSIIGKSRDDTLQSTQVGQTLLGKDGDDTFVFGRHSTVAIGGAGHDILTFVHGSVGARVQSLGSTFDPPPSGKWSLVAGIEKFVGTVGNDEFRGGGRAETLLGGRGHDKLLAGGGADEIRGGRGRDTIDGGRGDDTLSGGAGADTFMFSPGGGRDVWLDFDPGRDRIATMEETGRAFDEVIRYVGYSMSGVNIRLVGGGSVFLPELSIQDWRSFADDFGTT